MQWAKVESRVGPRGLVANGESACLTIQTQRCASYQQQPEGSENERMFLPTGFVLFRTASTSSYTSLGGHGGHEVLGGTGRKVDAQKSNVSKKYH